MKALTAFEMLLALLLLQMSNKTLIFEQKKVMAVVTNPFSNAQLALLELFTENLSDQELEELRQPLLEFRYQRLQKNLDALWEQGMVNEEKIESWGNEHLRTPYQSQQDFLARRSNP